MTRRRLTKSETFGAVQHEFVAILKVRGTATADALRDSLQIPIEGLSAIGRAIADLKRQGLIEEVGFALSQRRVTHARPLRVWRLT